MKQLRTAVTIAALVCGLSGCSTQTGAQKIDSSEPIAAAEARDEPGGPPPSRCNGIWDCTKTVFTDFVYLPVRIARGVSGDARTVADKDEHAPAE